jgi:hypothetical protein
LLCGFSTRWRIWPALRGSVPSPIALDRTWYSSSPSWRFRICDEIATGAASSSIVTSNVSTARWRWVNDTMRRDRIRTRLPPGVRQRMSRDMTPARKSSRRSYSTRSAIGSSSGSSST